MKILLLPIIAAVTLLAGTARHGPPDLKGIGIDQKLNAQVPMDTAFRDESGRVIQLRDYFGPHAVLLAPVYYTCPNLCSQILTGVVAGLRPLSLQPGRDFEIVAISFDPNDRPEIAREKRDRYVHSYSHKATAAGWHFLTGDQASITAVMNAIGFHYRWDARNKMFLHASGIMLLTPDGHVARYLYGVDYEPKDLKLGLIEASRRKIGSPVDRILLFCYHYDPATGKYGLVVINSLRIAAVATLIVLGIGLAVYWRRDLRTYHAEEPRRA
jgi:protein SCO1/2